MAKKAAQRKKSSAKKATSAKKAKPRAVRKPASPKRPVKKSKPSLGRPKVSAEEKLYFLFKDDYHARQIFEFLRTESVRDLEQFSPTEIVSRLSQPIKETVNRIRTKLAEKNRCLKDDQAYAVQHAMSDSEGERDAN
jgi:hypothetical protein